MKNTKENIAILLCAALLMSGCSGSNRPQVVTPAVTAAATNADDDNYGYGYGTFATVQTTQQIIPASTPIGWFAESEDKGDYTVMKVETSKGLENFKLSTFKEQLLAMDTPTKLQTSNRVTVCDESGVQIVYTENADGGISIDFCDVEVLKAAMDDSFCQVLHSKSTFFDMHMGTTTDYLTISEPSMKKVDSDITRSGCYKSINDGFTVTAYTNGGYTYYFILDVEAKLLMDSDAGSDNEKTAQTTQQVMPVGTEIIEESTTSDTNTAPISEDVSTVQSDDDTVTDYDDMWNVLPYIDETPVSELMYIYNDYYNGMEVYGYKGSSHAVRIPDMIDGEPVVSVSMYGSSGEENEEGFPLMTDFGVTELIVPDTAIRINLNKETIEYLNIPSGAAVSMEFRGPAPVRQLKLPFSSLRGLYLEADYFNSSLVKSCNDITVLKNGRKFTVKDIDEINEICVPYYVGKDSDGVYVSDCFDYAKEITIPEGVRTINHGAFEGCTALEKVTIPDSVEIICGYGDLLGSGAFSGCTSLRDVTIGSGIKVIGAGTFDNCNVRTLSIKLKNELTADPTYDSGSPIYLSDLFPNLETLIYVEGSEVVQGILFSNTLKVLKIAGTVAEIPKDAFAGCKSLNDVELGKGIKTISEGAFSGCTSLESIVIPNGVTKLGDINRSKTFGSPSFGGCFNGCSSLRKVDLPQSIEIIGENCFYGCSALEDIALGNNVKEIGGNAFNGCKGLRYLELSDDIYVLGYSDETGFAFFYEGAFENCENLSVKYKEKTYVYKDFNNLYKLIDDEYRDDVNSSYWG